MNSTWTAPARTPEEVRHDEMTAAGLKRGFMGRVVPIVDPSAPVLAPDFVKALDDQVKAGTLTYEDRKRLEYVEIQRQYAKRIEDAHGLNHSQLVRFLLRYGLSAIASGVLPINKKPGRRELVNGD